MEVREPSAKYLARPSFKQTELGLIPDDWEVSSIGSEFSIQLGKMLDAEKNVGVPKPFLGNRAVQWGCIDTSDIGTIRMTPYDLQRYRLRCGDLLVCEGGEVGRAAIWDAQLEECYYQKALHRLRPKRGYNTKLMLNFLQRFSVNGLLTNFVTQTSIAHLPKDKFETVPIPCPPTSTEQDAIADALSDADALIESLEQLIVKKHQIKQGAMQKLLTGKKRLPGFKGKWELKRLGDLLTIAHGKSQHSVADRNGIYPVLASGGQIGTANRFLYDKPSVLIGRKGTIDKPQFVDVPFWSVDTLFYSIIHEPNDAKFLFYRFCLIDWMQHNEASGVPSLNARTIERIEIGIPQQHEQSAIAVALSDMDTGIATLEAKLTKAHQVKQGMMQELLTGRIRLV